MDLECKYIKGLGLIGLGAGVLLILTGFLMTPSFVARSMVLSVLMWMIEISSKKVSPITSLTVNFNQVRPHSALCYRPPAPEAIQQLNMPVTLTQDVV